MKILNYLFPNWIPVKQATGEWNIKVSSDFFGDYNETKFCRFVVMYSDKLKKYKLKVSGYKPTEHRLYDLYTNSVIELNTQLKSI